MEISSTALLSEASPKRELVDGSHPLRVLPVSHPLARYSVIPVAGSVWQPS